MTLSHYFTDNSLVAVQYVKQIQGTEIIYYCLEGTLNVGIRTLMITAVKNLCNHYTTGQIRPTLSVRTESISEFNINIFLL